MQRLDGKVALITGAAQGMGAAHARACVAEGAQVVLTDLQVPRGEALAGELGNSAHFMRLDVSRREDWGAVVQEAERRFGPVNVLVNNAGILGPVVASKDMTDEDYLKVCSVNQHAVFWGMQAVLPPMLRAGVGSIINVSSVAGLVAIYGTPNPAYIASKFAVRGMTKQVAVEYGAHGIRANSVHPGFIKTPMMAAATDDTGGDALRQIPLRRLGTPDEVAQLIVFLASDESSYITGSELVVDGGMTSS